MPQSAMTACQIGTEMLSLHVLKFAGGCFVSRSPLNPGLGLRERVRGISSLNRAHWLGTELGPHPPTETDGVSLLNGHYGLGPLPPEPY